MMKAKKEREKQVSVHSSIAAASGPKPDIKVKRHFESAWKEKKTNYGTTASKPFGSLPCICEEREEETLIAQKSKLKTKQSHDKKKLPRRSKTQTSSAHKPTVPARYVKSSEQKQQKKRIQLNVTIPTADSTSSSNTTEQKITNTPITSTSELQLDAPTIINKENAQSDLDQIFNFNTLYQSEVDMLYSDKPLFTNFSVAPYEDNIEKTFLWNPSLVCKILNKPDEQTIYKAADTVISMNEESLGMKTFDNHNIHNANITHDVPSFVSSTDIPVYQCKNDCEKLDKKRSEERNIQVQEIQLELLRWREKLKEKQKNEEKAKKSLSINTVSVEAYGREKKNLQKTPLTFEPLQEAEEETSDSGSNSSSGQQRHLSSTSAPPPSPASQQQ